MPRHSSYTQASLKASEKRCLILIPCTVLQVLSKDQFFYVSCATCKRKVSDVSGAHSVTTARDQATSCRGHSFRCDDEFQCEHCHQYTRKRVRYVLKLRVSDATTVQTVSLFGSAVSTALGLSASQLLQAMRDGHKTPQDVFQTLHHSFVGKQFVFGFEKKKTSIGPHPAIPQLVHLSTLAKNLVASSWTPLFVAPSDAATTLLHQTSEKASTLATDRESRKKSSEDLSNNNVCGTLRSVAQTTPARVRSPKEYLHTLITPPAPNFSQLPHTPSPFGGMTTENVEHPNTRVLDTPARDLVISQPANLVLSSSNVVPSSLPSIVTQEKPAVMAPAPSEIDSPRITPIEKVEHINPMKSPEELSTSAGETHKKQKISREKPSQTSLLSSPTQAAVGRSNVLHGTAHQHKWQQEIISHLDTGDKEVDKKRVQNASHRFSEERTRTDAPELQEQSSKRLKRQRSIAVRDKFPPLSLKPLKPLFTA